MEDIARKLRDTRQAIKNLRAECMDEPNAAPDISGISPKRKMLTKWAQIEAIMGCSKGYGKSIFKDMMADPSFPGRTRPETGKPLIYQDELENWIRRRG